MESTHDGSPTGIQSAVDRVNNDMKSGVKNVHAVGSSELQRLIADVEELVGRIANLKDADVVRVRGRVEQALASAKQSFASAKQSFVNGTESVRSQVREVASSTDGYVRESPWQALGIAALVGVAVGFLISRRS
ncbi:MAG: YqjD family protein [Steroidobacteraceae bacterium]|jgi:ElaB/YqjD/DUF883 family membrane-anchored ribosome-binding protein